MSYDWQKDLQNKIDGRKKKLTAAGWAVVFSALIVCCILSYGIWMLLCR